MDFDPSEPRDDHGMWTTGMHLQAAKDLRVQADAHGNNALGNAARAKAAEHEATARELSTGNVLYHGTTKQFGDFKLGGSSMQAGFPAVHLTDDPKFASLYSQGKGGRIIPVKLAADAKVLDVTGFHDASNPIVKDLYKGTGRTPFVGSGDLAGKTFLNLDVFSAKKVSSVLQKHGIDAVKYEAKFGNQGLHGQTIAHKATAYAVVNLDKLKQIKIA